MTRIAITSPDAVAVGPYSHGILGDGYVFLSGQTPIEPATGVLIDGPVEAQTRQCLANLAAVLSAGGLGFEDVVKANVYLTDMADFPAMNAAYTEHFDEPYPARTTIGVAALPLGAQVEIEMIARRH